LERGRKGLLLVAISDLGDLKLQSYRHFKIELLKSRKGDMRKFDGKDPVNWILQMEQYFDLHGVQLLQKVRIASSHLESNQFLWYKGIFSRKPLVTWSIFTEEMIAHYEDTKRNTFFSQFINLKQKDSMAEHIVNFQKLNIRVNDIPEKKRIDVFIGTLKDNIQHEVRLWDLIHWRRHLGWQEKLEVELWKQGILPLTTINMEMFFLLAFHSLQGLCHNNWKKKEKKEFVKFFIENTLKVISVMRRNYST